jgi:hypothetical protein
MTTCEAVDPSRDQVVQPLADQFPESSSSSTLSTPPALDRSLGATELEVVDDSVLATLGRGESEIESSVALRLSCKPLPSLMVAVVGE